jgi:hypothetical protein
MYEENKMENEFDYKNDILIDENALDLEWSKQPYTYQKYAEKAALLEADVRRAKDSLELIYAETDEKVRASFCDKKSTEAMVKAGILQDASYQSVQKKLVDTLQEKGTFDAVAQSFEHKKKALEKLVDLHLSGYSSSPRVQQREVSEITHNKIKGKLNAKD